MEGPSPKRALSGGLACIFFFFPVALLIGNVLARSSSWRGTAELHTLFETIATVLGFVTGAKALVRYYAKKNAMFLFLGTGFLGSAFLNCYHVLVTSPSATLHTPGILSDLTPWSGIMPRVFMSLLMCASVVALRREKLRPTVAGIRESLVYLLVGIAAIITFLLFALLDVPPPFGRNHMVHRPADFVPALSFTMAAVGYLWHGSWKTDAFQRWLVSSLILYAVADAGYMAFYSSQYDAQFFIGHGLKIVGHLTVLTGLFINMFSVFQSEARSATDLLQANHLLSTQLDLERRLVSDLEKAEYRAAHDFLSGLYNRAAIMDLLDREASRCKRAGHEADY